MKIRLSRALVLIIGFLLIFFVISLYINYREINQSGAYQEALEIIRKDKKLLDNIGGIRGFGMPLILEKKEKMHFYEIPVNGHAKIVRIRIEMRQNLKNQWEVVTYKIIE